MTQPQVQTQNKFPLKDKHYIFFSVGNPIGEEFYLAIKKLRPQRLDISLNATVRISRFELPGIKMYEMLDYISYRNGRRFFIRDDNGDFENALNTLLSNTRASVSKEYGIDFNEKIKDEYIYYFKDDDSIISAWEKGKKIEIWLDKTGMTTRTQKAMTQNGIIIRVHLKDILKLFYAYIKVNYWEADIIQITDFLEGE